MPLAETALPYGTWPQADTANRPTDFDRSRQVWFLPAEAANPHLIRDAPNYMAFLFCDAVRQASG